MFVALKVVMVGCKGVIEAACGFTGVPVAETRCDSEDIGSGPAFGVQCCDPKEKLKRHQGLGFT